MIKEYIEGRKLEVETQELEIHLKIMLGCVSEFNYQDRETLLEAIHAVRELEDLRKKGKTE